MKVSSGMICNERTCRSVFKRLIFSVISNKSCVCVCVWWSRLAGCVPTVQPQGADFCLGSSMSWGAIRPTVSPPQRVPDTVRMYVEKLCLQIAILPPPPPSLWSILCWLFQLTSCHLWESDDSLSCVITLEQVGKKKKKEKKTELSYDFSSPQQQKVTAV